MRSACIVLIALVPAVASATSIAGIPQAPTAWDQPSWWVGTTNDSFGGGFADDDDFRSAGMRAGWHAGRWDGALDYSILTNRGGAGRARRTRSDEATVTAGYRLIDLGSCRDALRLRLSAGGGARLDGDLGGAAVQNADHRLFGYHRVNLRYERHRDLDGLGYVHGDVLATPDLPVPDCAVLPDFNGQWGLRADAAVIAATGGDVRESVGLRAELLGREAEGWLGIDWRWSQGVAPSRTSAVVNQREDGPWIVTGTCAYLGNGTSLAVDAGVDPATREAMGMLALAYGMTSAKCPDGENGELYEEIGYQRGGPVVRVRWHPDWTDVVLPDRLCLDTFGDYRFGHVTGQTVAGARILTAQWTIGYQLGVPFGSERWQLRPYVEGCGGLRREAVRLVSAGGSRDVRSERPVLQGGVGASVLWNGSIGVCVGVDRWLPLGGPVEVPGTGGEEFQRAGWSPGARLVLAESF